VSYNLPNMARRAEQPKETETAQEQGNVIEVEEMQLATRHSTFHTGGNATPNGTDDLENPQNRYSPLFLPEESPPAPAKTTGGVTNHEGFRTTSVLIVVPSVERRWEYQPYIEAPVDKLIREYDDGKETRYLVRLRDGCEQKVCPVLSSNSQSHIKATTQLVWLPHSPFLHHHLTIPFNNQLIAVF